jgi:hypothetical protein
VKKRLLKVKQNFARVGNLPKKPAIGEKTKPLGFQKVGLGSGQPRVIGLGCFIMPFGMGKC